ncbi:MAG: DHH family phosphoesterase [Patescibacteria group bacterium]
MQKWVVKENILKEQIVKNDTDVNPVISQLLINRGISAEQAKNFLEPNYQEQSYDPFLFKQMNAVVDLIKQHLEAGNKIIVYGDYDADGVTATAIMYKTLNFLSNEIGSASKLGVYIPDRASEGYGLKKSAIKHLAAGGAKLIITVDNATRNVDEVEYAKTLGLDIIITDHHEPASAKASAGKPENALPNCLIINPKIEGETYPFFSLAGCGVAFKVSQGLLSKMTQNSKGDIFLKWLLDLVAIGTVADLVPLIDENRMLVKYGLVVLNKTSRIGLKKLIEVAHSGTDKNGNGREIDSWQVGFQLAPRLNAAGRLDHANTAYELLITEDEAEAIKIAEQLNVTNQERQRLTEEIFQYADKQINQNDKILLAVWHGLNCQAPSFEEGVGGGESNRNLNQSKVEVITDNKQKNNSAAPWPAGVMGLVSGKLTEKYYRPSLAITDKNGSVQVSVDLEAVGEKVLANENGIVGSGRSIAEFDITAMLEQCAEFLTNFGGHKQACGFTLKDKESLAPFLTKAKEIAEKELAGLELAPTLEIDLEINFADISEDLHAAMQKLRPFGVDNPQPKFLTKNLTVVNVMNMGADGQHIKLKVKSEELKIMDAIAFSVTDDWKRIKVGDKIDLVYYIDMNEWNGRREVQLKIIDLKSHNT